MSTMPIATAVKAVMEDMVHRYSLFVMYVDDIRRMIDAIYCVRKIFWADATPSGFHDYCLLVVDRKYLASVSEPSHNHTVGMG